MLLSGRWYRSRHEEIRHRQAESTPDGHPEAVQHLSRREHWQIQGSSLPGIDRRGELCIFVLPGLKFGLLRE